MNRTQAVQEQAFDLEAWQRLYYQQQQHYIRQRLEAVKLLHQGQSRNQVCDEVRCSYDTLTSCLVEQDIIYVGGGNTRNLVALWREWGLDRFLKEAWEGGTILCGLSAGSLYWFESGVSDYPGNGVLKTLNCLGFLQSHCPHYDGEANRRPAYH